MPDLSKIKTKEEFAQFFDYNVLNKNSQEEEIRHALDVMWKYHL